MGTNTGTEPESQKWKEGRLEGNVYIILYYIYPLMISIIQYIM